MPRKANPNRPEYAKLIAEARESQNLSQQQLGQLIGRDTATVKKYEAGKILPPFFVLMTIANELSLDKKSLANLVMKEASAENWLDAAFEEITWIFKLTKVGVYFQNKPDKICFTHDTRERVFDKLDFLLVISRILQDAHVTFNDYVASETDNFVKSLFRNNDIQDY